MMNIWNDVTLAEYNEFSLNENPFVDALPSCLSISELNEKTAIHISLPDDYRSYSPQQRQILNSQIKRLYLPTEYTADIYSHLYQGLVTSYTGKPLKSIIASQDRLGCMMYHQKPHFDFDSDLGFTAPTTNSMAESFSILGDAGTGKTSAVKRVLECFPAMIQHENYHGIKLNHIQITYIMVECPADYSPKSICFQILMKIDSLLGTKFSTEAHLRKNSLDFLIVQIAQLCQRFSIGAIIIDEIQNILSMSAQAKASSRFVKFLLELHNLTGVCLVCLGTTLVSDYFDASPHLARRTRGPRMAPLTNSDTFRVTLQAMWDNAAVLKPVPLTGEIRDLCYRMTGGIFAYMAMLIMKAADEAIFFGTESITPELLKKVASKYAIQTKSIADGPRNIQLLQAKSKKKGETVIQKEKLFLSPEEELNLVLAFKRKVDIGAFIRQKNLLFEG